jgi:mannan endo-1,4-beta-mannosidase
MTMSQPELSPPSPPRRTRRFRVAVIGAGLVIAAALVTAGVHQVTKPIGTTQPSAYGSAPPIGTFSHHPVVIALPTQQTSYLGAFAKGVPHSYAPMKSFAHATGAHLNVALYYSGWYERFQNSFASQARDNDAVPFIQIDPTGIRFTGIVNGDFDTYLKRMATDVASYGARTDQGVIIGFGHEMNGDWFSWGNGHVAPALFKAAWRHIVNVFRQQGADDVTWLWTVNIIDTRKHIPSPAAWWPGSSYVTWVGIDGYYLKPSWSFASLFGPTIKVVRALTPDPHILISETGASPAVGQPAKIDNLFAGVQRYGLLGFVWFDSKGTQDWRLSSRAAFAAFRRGSKTFDEATP